MAEIVGFAASTITLLATAYDTYQTLYNVLEGIRNAPKCIDSLRQDVDNVCRVLGALKSLLDDEESVNGVSQSLTSDSLTKILNHCLRSANDLGDMISDFAPGKSGQKLSIWRSGIWVVKKRVVEGYRRDLHEQKMTLSMALAVASWYNTNSLRATASEFTAYFRQLQEKLPAILGDNHAPIPLHPAPSQHHEEHRNRVEVDFAFPLNRYLNTAVSIISSGLRPDPSPQISSLGVTLKTMSTSFKTAPTHRSNNPPSAPVVTPCTWIKVANVCQYKPIDLSVKPTDTVEMIKDKVRLKIGLPTATIQLLHQRVILDHPTKTLDDYAIPNDTTRRCASFQPDNRLPGPWLGWIFIPSVDIIDNLLGLLRRTTVAVHIGDEVHHIKAKYTNIRSETTEGLVFVYSGRPLDDSTLMVSDIFSTSVNARYVIQLMRNQRRPVPFGNRLSMDPPEHANMLPPLSENSELSKLAILPASIYQEPRRSLNQADLPGFVERGKTHAYFRGLTKYFRPTKKWKKSANKEVFV